MAQVAITTSGLPNLKAALLRFGKGGRRVLREAMIEALRPAFEETQDRVPVKSGKLKASGRISVRAGEKQLTAKILYGGDGVPYALIVHENLEHDHPNGGQAKYVESVVRSYPFAQHLAGLIKLDDMARG